MIGQAQTEKKILENIHNKELVSKINKELLKLNNKNQIIHNLKLDNRSE